MTNPSREEQLEAIRGKCIEANPEIQPKFFTHPSHGRPVRLSDILLAIQIWAEFKPGFFPQEAEDVMRMWNLRADDLGEQNDECIQFIYSLLT